MSPELLKVLSTVHTGKKFMIYSRGTSCMDVMKLKVARQLVHYREFALQLWDMDNTTRVFDFLAIARPVIQVARIDLEVWRHGAAFADTLLNVVYCPCYDHCCITYLDLFQYFTKTARSLQETVPEVTIHCYFHLLGWPRNCPKYHATVVHGKHYTFRYNNENSGEEFEMELKSAYSRKRRVPDENEKVTEIRLKFY